MVLLWYPGAVDDTTRRLIAGAFVVALIARLALPIYALGSSLFFEHFLAPSQAEAVGAIEETSGDIRELQRLGAAGPELDPDATWLERVSVWFAEAVEGLDVRDRIEAFRERLAAVTKQVVQLVVVFTLQTIALPLAFLWMLPRVVGWTMRQLA